MNGTKVIAQTDTNNNTLYFHYGCDGVTSFELNGTTYIYKKNIQNDIVGIYDINGNELVKYTYDAWGNHKTYVLNDSTYVDIDETFSYTESGLNNKDIAKLNPFRYRSYYYDSEIGLYYLNSRYYDPELGRFINADDISILDISNVALNGLNLYSYCLNNPINEVDENGNLPRWLKWLIGGVIILGLAIATIATGGAAGGAAGFIFAGALKGAIIGSISGAAIGGLIGGITSVISGDSFWIGFLDGAADGFMSGAITGAISGAISNSIRVVNAAKMWGAGKGVTPMQNMFKHFNKHVIREGHKYLGKNVIQYTKNAVQFFNSNKGLLELTKSGNYVIRAIFNGQKAGGFFNIVGTIFSFF